MMKSNELILVSACLAGVNCRYDSSSKKITYILDLVKNKKAILVCPEELGGLSTPRACAEQVGNKVMTIDGEDVTNQFILGAEEGLKIANLYQIKKAILKSKSPSCGYKKVYDGSFLGNLKIGNGIFAQKLIDNQIEVFSSENFE